MSALDNRVLIISDVIPPKLLIETDHIVGASGSIRPKHFRYDVICANFTDFGNPGIQSLLKKVSEVNPSLQLVAVKDSHELNNNTKIFSELSFYKIINSWTSSNFEPTLIMALEMAQKARQDDDLESLVDTQKNKLKQLYRELEERVEKRQRYLLEARTKTFVAQTRWESMRHALMAIHRAKSVSEIEQNLSEVLSPTMNLEIIRIIFRPQDQIFSQQTDLALSLARFQVPLFKGPETIGSIFYLRDKGRPFFKDETDFFLRISEAVGLAVDRLQKLEQSELLKDQWDATFNSVSDPLVIIDSNYQVIQGNDAFYSKQGLTFDGASKQKCFSVLFGKDSPCQGCSLGSNFKLEGKAFKNLTYEVSSQSIIFSESSETVYVNLYHDITEQTKLERRLVENSKLAELGTIGSSIAHELNNPLGGILSFVQLIKMDLSPEDPVFPDIVEMEQGVRRCQDIVQNLLGFTRIGTSEEPQTVDLREILNQTIKVLDLQTKSRGIQIKTYFPSEPSLISGIPHLLNQAFKNILQNSIDSLIEKILYQRGFQAQIDIHIVNTAKDSIEVNILDNGLGLDHRANLNMSVAQQILHDHKAALDFSSQSRQLAMAKISFPRPVLQENQAN